MAIKETTTFQIRDALRVEVTGASLTIYSQSVPIHLDRSSARDLSKALSHAADIVRSPRKRKAPNAPSS